MKNRFYIPFVLFATLVASATATAQAAEPPDAIAPITVWVSLESDGPTIASSPTLFSMAADEGGSIVSDTLLVWNGSSVGMLDYATETTPTWLSCYPTTGSSTGAAVPHMVFVDPSGLYPGDYGGTITITAAEASNSPLMIPVHVHVRERPGYWLWTSVAPPKRSGTVEPAGATLHGVGDTVWIAATANKAWQFSHWTGDASGRDNPTGVVMDSNKRVKAHFRRIPGPNLGGRLDAITPQPIVLGQDIIVSGQVFNDGDEPTAESAGTGPLFRVEFWAVNAATGWLTPLCAPIELSGGLAAGEVIDLSLFPPRVCFANIPPGVYRIEMRIDPEGAVFETEQVDNIVWGPAAIILPDAPDLLLRDFDFAPVTADPAGGTPIAFSGRLLNSGSQPTTGPFWLEFRVWPEARFQSNGPPLCESALVTQSLGLGASVDLQSLPARVTYPLEPGIYYVGVIADPAAEVYEQREDNNVEWITLKKLHVGSRPSRAKKWRLYR